MKSLFAHLLHRWILRVLTHPRPVLAASLVLALFALALAGTRLSVDTNPANMLSAELPWRQAEQALQDAFPDSEPGLVLVIDGASIEAAAATQAALVTALQPQVEHFLAVRAAELDPYFRRHGLLYLELDGLQDFADSLLRAQPFLGALAREPSLSGIANLLSRVLEAPEQGFDLAPALNAFADSVDAAARGQAQPLAWSRLMVTPAGLNPGTRRFIELQPVLDYGRLQPATEAVQAIRAAIAALPQPATATVRLTGSKALEHEEIGMAFSGALLAFGVALVLATGLLFVALRSGRLVGATVLTLLFGLILTAGFAALAVGQLNLISMAFAVLYVGLGLDYALYLAMRYRELRQAGVGHRNAIPQAAGDVGGFLFVCAATTSLGFLAFVPTSFTGIAGLGLISGAGMFISLLASLSVLPALLALWPAIDTPPARPSPRLDRLLELPYTRARPIWLTMALLLAGAALLAPRARFDFDPLHLRDPDSESVSTFRDLLRDPAIPTLTLSAVVADDAAARALSATLAQRPTVARAMSVLDLIPTEQDEKLALIEELNLSLGPAITGGAELQVLSRPEDAASLDRLQDAMSRAGQLWQGESAAAAKRLAGALSKLQQAPEPDLHIRLLRDNLLTALPAQISQLRELLSAGPVTEAELPGWLRARWRASDGRPRVEVWPREVLDDNAATARFVADVRAAAPTVSGGPVGMIEAGQAVVRAFRQAFLYSLIAITLLLWLLLRSLRDTLLVLVPLVAAGLLTLAGSVLFDTPFNFANVIALPLLLGVGVDYGVYLVQQGRQLPANSNLLKTGATRAVLFGALVTLANFGDLMLARHPGMVSMGLLLTVGLSMILICTLVLLPSLLRRFRS
ncbi:MAG: MMPL family transporter [Stagnimonas sp.]|nr:MMPL family transporter [Stagnimonas sp.]